MRIPLIADDPRMLVVPAMVLVIVVALTGRMVALVDTAVCRVSEPVRRVPKLM
jgi:hypothetical protein